MHTHVSAVTAIYIFLMVAIIGGFWRLAAAALVRQGGTAKAIGQAMAFQF